MVKVGDIVCFGGRDYIIKGMFQIEGEYDGDFIDIAYLSNGEFYDCVAEPIEKEE